MGFGSSIPRSTLKPELLEVVQGSYPCTPRRTPKPQHRFIGLPKDKGLQNNYVLPTRKLITEEALGRCSGLGFRDWGILGEAVGTQKVGSEPLYHV